MYINVEISDNSYTISKVENKPQSTNLAEETLEKLKTILTTDMQAHAGCQYASMAREDQHREIKKLSNEIAENFETKRNAHECFLCKWLRDCISSTWLQFIFPFMRPTNEKVVNLQHFIGGFSHKEELLSCVKEYYQHGALPRQLVVYNGFEFDTEATLEKLKKCSSKDVIDILRHARNVASEYRDRFTKFLLECTEEETIQVEPLDPHLAPYVDKQLFQAALAGNSTLTKLLLLHGASVDAKSSTNIKTSWGASVVEATPLIAATIHGHREVAQCLFDHSANIDAPARDGMSALCLAIEAHQMAVVELLLAKGANPDLADPSGWTPLHSAAKWGCTEAVLMLLPKIANINCQADGLTTPLDLAARYGQTEAVQTLLEHGADPNIADGHHTSSLHWAVRYSALALECEVVTALLPHIKDINARDQFNQTALDDAKLFKMNDVADLLRKWGAVD